MLHALQLVHCFDRHVCHGSNGLGHSLNNFIFKPIWRMISKYLPGLLNLLISQILEYPSELFLTFQLLQHLLHLLLGFVDDFDDRHNFRSLFQ